MLKLSISLNPILYSVTYKNMSTSLVKIEIKLELIIFFLFLNISVFTYYKINNLNFNALKLIKNIKNLKTQ